ncbi:MAG: energy transducer TonB [Burkholderiaceae bacterium]|nr:energy transducer TonB [Burkholderiaceae bacterium]
MRSFSTLQIALGVSVALHAVLLTVRFVDPQAFNRIFQDSPLEVILVNAKANERVDKPQAIAQFALAGGGNVEKGRATSPLPASALTARGDASEDSQRRIDSMQEQQMLMLAQIRQTLAAMPPPDPRRLSNSAEARANEERRRQLMQLLAEIERRVNEENARPKRRYISPSTAAGVHALYYSRFKERVENLGTTNFPTLAGNKLYGELTMLISLNSMGEVISTEIVQTSGNRALDRIAQAIVRAGAPYGQFSPAMLREFQIMVVSSRFRFTRDEVLETVTTTAGGARAESP